MSLIVYIFLKDWEVWLIIICEVYNVIRKYEILKLLIFLFYKI